MATNTQGAISMRLREPLLSEDRLINPRFVWSWFLTSASPVANWLLAVPPIILRARIEFLKLFHQSKRSIWILKMCEEVGQWYYFVFFQIQKMNEEMWFDEKKLFDKETEPLKKCQESWALTRQWFRTDIKLHTLGPARVLDQQAAQCLCQHQPQTHQPKKRACVGTSTGA